MDKRKPEWIPESGGSEYASRVVKGVASPAQLAHSFQGRKPRGWDLPAIAQGVLAGNASFLARGITLIESNHESHFELAQELLRELLPYSGKSIRIGITGVPGAGKSTFIESFGIHLIRQGKKVAVLAIDPSSTISKGSILGDKTRMEELSKEPNSFIRPSPSSGVLGGVAKKTRESMVLCEAAGFDVILIETVGVGQSETSVRSMVDFFLLLQIAGAGDELQGIKKGIMELADHIVVNKADLDNVQRAQVAMQEYNNALHYIRQATPNWQTKASTCSALLGDGVPEIWQVVQDFIRQNTANGVFEERRRQQTLDWFEHLISEAVLHRFFQDPKIQEKLPLLRNGVVKGDLPVALAVSQLLE